MSKQRSEQGAVTIFLIVIFAFIFAFVAVFIDFARMSALQVKAEELAQAVSRSVLSSFDRLLLEEYGLFAYGETDVNYIMSKVLQENLELTRRSDGISIMKARLDESSLEMLRPLGIHEVLMRQIREEMKYKAPIELTLEVVNRFTPLAHVMKEASHTVDLLSKLKRLYDQREEKLDALLENQMKAAALLDGFSAYLFRNTTAIFDDYVNGEISNLQEAASQYADYQSKLEEDRERDYEDRLYTYEISRYRDSTSSVFRSLQRSIQKAEGEHIKRLADAKQLLDEVRKINDEMRLVIEASRNHPNESEYNLLADGAGTLENEMVSGAHEIAEIRGKTDTLLLSDSLLLKLDETIALQGNMFEAFYQQMQITSGRESNVLVASEESRILKQDVIESAKRYDTYLLHFQDSTSSVLVEIEKQLQTYRSLDAERRRTEQEVKVELQGAGQLLQQIEAFKHKLGAHQKPFDQLKSYFEETQELNQGYETDAQESEEGGTTSTEPYEVTEQAMQKMDALFVNLSELVSLMTDKAFLTEYIVSYFDYFNVSYLGSLFKKEANISKRIVDQFAPEQQGIEYILYGSHQPVGNVSLAFGEIFTMRLAIRTMEGLIKNLNKVDPLLILASALLYGVKEAVKDLMMLTEKGSIPLSSFMPVNLTYRDHLRLFLLLHGGQQERLSRVLSLIRLKTGINPSERATYVKTQVRLAIPLWFVPGISKMVGNAGALQGQVEGSRYYVIKEAHFFY